MEAHRNDTQPNAMVDHKTETVANHTMVMAVHMMAAHIH